MADQLGLAGFDAAPQPTDRLFFAVFPDPGTAARITQLAQQLRDDCRLQGPLIRPERLHVTLHHLGDFVGVPPDTVAMAMAAAARVALPPFELVFDRAVSFAGKPGKRPFVLRGDEGLLAVTALQQQLGAAMKQVGLGRRAEARFSPHVTMLYDGRAVPEQAVEAVAWTAREFILVRSLLGKTVHEVLGRWPLAA